jgi:ABC-type multidrug transport system ATPase subunit
MIFDESTAMLDPLGRRDIMNTIEKLNREHGITIIMITHYMDEAARANRIVVIDDGEILIDDKLEWYCPNCGNRDHDKLNVARRTCGYIGTNFWNKGRTQEIKERVIHMDNKDAEE